MLQENKIKSLYEDGLVNFNSFFEKDLLQELVVAKENLFNEYPYGQDDKLNKKTKSDFVRPGSYMIWDVIEKKPVCDCYEICKYNPGDSDGISNVTINGSNLTINFYDKF